MLFVTLSSAASHGRAQHVRWDIISLVGGNPPGPINPGGHASATAPNGGDTITLTGSGTFVALPAAEGECRHRRRHLDDLQRRKRHVYRYGAGQLGVRKRPGANPAFIDNIDHGTRVDAHAILTIAFSDGTQGVLTVGCHGPGAPPGIFEGHRDNEGVHDLLRGSGSSGRSGTRIARTSTFANAKRRQGGWRPPLPSLTWFS